MKTQREKTIRRYNDKKLMEYIYAHSERGMDRIISALCNLQIASWDADPEKVESARDYSIKCLEDISALRFALQDLNRRYKMIKREDRAKAKYIKEILKEDIPEPDEIEVPNWF